MSEKVYTFQRIFNIRLGKGLREHDSNLPYRAVGPVTSLEYESRLERYDTQLKEIGFDISVKTTQEKIKILREYREQQYVKLQDAVYLERGWNKKGCPTIDLVRKLEIDFHEVIKYIKPYQE
jgi:aldehyde:ferredoxin oxidoreductase